MPPSSESLGAPPRRPLPRASGSPPDDVPVGTVAVVGAGLAGLAAAFRLVEAGADVRVFEADHRIGGVVGSHGEDGFLAERGPHSLGRPAPRIRELLSRAGLDGSVVVPDPDRSRRFIVKGGVLHPLPTSLPGLLTSPLLGWGSLLRLVAEPLRPGNGPEPGGDESVAALLRRRGLGEDLVQGFLDPFVAGVYAGDPERLSVRHAFPLLHGLQDEHGSLLRGLVVRGLRSRRRRKEGTPSRRAAVPRGSLLPRGEAGRGEPAPPGEAPPPAVMSFRGGMEELPRALARPFRERVRTGVRIRELQRDPDGGGWELLGDGGSLGRYAQVILALPAHALADLALPGGGAGGLAPVGAVRHPPVSLLTLGFPRTPGQHPLDGFGMLAPRVEGRRILGALFPSTLFPHRAPPGHVAVAVFVGGTRQPELALQDPPDVEQVAREELQLLLGIREAPVFRHHAHWPRAIPQYEVGYHRVQDAAEGLEALLPGVFLAGSWRGGVSVGDALGSGLDAAGRALSPHPGA